MLARVLCLAACLLIFPVIKIHAADYLGANVCASCHTEQMQDWVKSDHFKAMAEPNAQTVLGDFSDITVPFHGIDNRFYQKNGDYFIETIGQEGKRESFKVLYTFGHFPLQQYLVSIGGGHLQAMNLAWDSRTKEDGGQRWYHLQPDEDMTPDNPFFWTGHFQNWNSRCADCHSTNLQKNYNPDDHSYNTTWSEINVSCESCHGPGSDHVALVKTKKYSATHTGLAYTKPENLSWLYNETDPIAKPHGQKSDAHIDMCGGCHSRRLQVDDPTKFDDYHDKYRLQTLSEGLYFDDGQIQDEVYVLGSFLQSKMHHAGVTCMNCHNPHSGKLVAEPNQVCAQCHQPSTYDKPKHTLHPANTSGAQCVNCHMPERTYMQVDPRRDHSFTIPNPALSIKAGVPNACTGCHEDKDNKWAANVLKEKGVKSAGFHWAELSDQVRSLDMLAVRPLSIAANDENLPEIVRATFVEELANFPSRVAIEASEKALKSKDPMVRRAAVSSLAGADPQTRWQLLYPLLNDPVRSVRFDIAATLADIYSQLPVNYQAELNALIDEYKSTLSITADFPSSQLAFANLALRLGDAEEAQAAYKRALRIAPDYIPALLNLADFYRSAQQPDKELPLLQKALSVVPESASVQHGLGLYYVRKKEYEKSLPYLKAATGDSPDSNPRYNYVYAVALDTLGQTKDAVRVLQKSDKRWPNQYDTLSTLIIYLEKTGNEASVYKYLSQLSRIAPNSPQVQRLVQKYR